MEDQAAVKGGTTRDRLLEAAVRAYAESGTKGATTRRIAELAGVNEVTLFRSFGTKAALMEEALRVKTQSISASRRLPEVPGNAEEELTAWFSRSLHGIRHAQALIRSAIGEMDQEAEVVEWAKAVPLNTTRELVRYFTLLRDRGDVSPDADPAVAAATLMSAVFQDGLNRDLMPEVYPYSAEDAPRRYVQTVLHGLLKR